MERDVQADLAKGLAALVAKQQYVTECEDFYHGKSDVPWLSARLQSIFKNLDVDDLRVNVCKTVIDSCADRITLTGFTVADEAVQTELDTLVATSEALLEADDVHRHALITGQGYIVVWRDTDDDPIDLYFNAAHLCHVQPEKHRPNVTRYAIKWWKEDDGRICLRLYYPDIIYAYVTDGKVEGLGKVKAGELLPDFETPEIVNPYGVVPVFVLQPERRKVISDIADIVPLQRALNMAFINKLVAGEFNAFRQKYLISNADTPGMLKAAPGTVWTFPASEAGEQPTAVGEFGETDLGNYVNDMASDMQIIAAVSRTPLHYFMPSSSQVPSGEALIALEAPLNKKAQDRIDRFAVVWKKIAAFVLQIAGYTVQPNDITPQFVRPETVTPLTAATVLKTRTDAGMPLVSALRLEGRSETEIDQIAADQANTQQAAVSSAVRQFNAGN